MARVILEIELPGLAYRRALELPERTERFTHGLSGDVCAGSFGPFFAETLSLVESACDAFVPVP